MRIVRHRAEARSLPSRHHLAIFKLAAFYRLWHAEPRREEILLAIDEHQSTAESLVTGFWFFASSASFLATLLPRWPDVLAFLVSFAAAIVLFQFVFISLGLTVTRLWRRLTRSTTDDNADFNATLCFLLLGAAALWFLHDKSWVRYVAWLYFVCIAMNASAALILRFLRRHIDGLEAAFGGASSGV